VRLWTPDEISTIADMRYLACSLDHPTEQHNLRLKADLSDLYPSIFYTRRCILQGNIVFECIVLNSPEAWRGT
jgi:hypothetical protein